MVPREDDLQFSRIVGVVGDFSSYLTKGQYSRNCFLFYSSLVRKDFLFFF
jgi:hypothetical protein